MLKHHCGASWDGLATMQDTTLSGHERVSLCTGQWCPGAPPPTASMVQDANVSASQLRPVHTINKL